MEQGLRQGCVFAPFLLNVLFAPVVNVAYTRFKVGIHIMDALVHLSKKTGTEGRGEGTAGEPALATSLWGIIYADEIRVVSRTSEQLRKTMGVIVPTWAAFLLTVSEAKTEIMCLRTKGMPEATGIFSVEAVGQVYSQ